jgi:hypothetical protein
MTPEKAKEMNEERALENGDKLAFPIDSSIPYHNGLTKREYIATQLLSGVVARSSIETVHTLMDDVIRVTDLLLIKLHGK